VTARPAPAGGGGRRRCQAGIHLRPPWAADPAVALLRRSG